MSFQNRVLRAKHLRWLRKTKGLRAHLAARARAIEANRVYDPTKIFSCAEEFSDYMRNKIGCGP